MKQQEQQATPADTPNPNPAEPAQATAEAPDEPADTAAQPAEAATDAAQLEAVTAKLTAAQDRLLRLQADFDNFRKRQTRERADIIKRANEDFAEDIVTVLDNFDHAFKALPAADQTDSNPFFKGFSLVQQSFLSVLEKNGVKPLPDPIGKPLDPNTCEVVSILTTGSQKPGHVLYVTRQGYLLHDRVLRATQVVVEQEQEEAEEPTPDAEAPTDDTAAEAAAPAADATQPTTEEA